MAFSQKNNPPKVASFPGKLPEEFPRLPEEIANRFPAGAKMYGDQCQIFWQQAARTISEREGALESAVNAQAAEIEELKKRIAALEL